jgi:hypothetical protein
MFKPKLTYANVVATVALVFSMTGGALAASHYLINSTKQINPKVLRALHGAKGAKGATGTPGRPGSVGPTGPAGGNGIAGLAGKEGREGDRGAHGIPGATGETGATGAPGEAGSSGPKGEKGEAGATGEKGATGETGATGDKGATGESGGPLAYAHIQEGGKVDTANSHNVGSSEEVSKGIYCISGITGSIHTVVATVDMEESSELAGINATANGAAKGTACPAPTQITVETYELGGTTKVEGLLEHEGFYIDVN